MKNKTIALGLILALLLAVLAGCGGKSEPQSTDPVSDIQPDAADQLFQAGAVEGGTYTNDMLGLGCTLGSDWTFASEEEIAATFGMAKDLIDQAQTGIDLDDAQVFTDLYVYADGGLENINIQVQTLGALEGVAMGNTSEEELLDNLLPTLQTTMESAYGSLGTVTCEKADATFLGADHKVIAMVTTVEDMEIYQKQAYLPRGRYVAIVTCTSVGTDVTDDLLELFYAV